MVFSHFGEVLTQVLSAHGIGVRNFLAEAKVGKTSRQHLRRFIARESAVSQTTYERRVAFLYLCMAN